MPATAIDPQLAFLDLRQTVTVISDSDLVTKVEKAPLPSGITLRPKQTLAPIDALNGGLPLAPSDLLAELAEAFCPPLISSSLRDLTLRWSWLRYCWAFEEVAEGSRMRPSPAAMGLVAHHRLLASEQLGIAMALAIARRYLTELHRARAVVFIDADLALTGSGSGLLGVSTLPGSRMRPDYFALVDGVTSETPHLPGVFLYSIECKGSYGSIHNRQLKKAACQVQAVGNRLGNPPPSLLFATGVLKTGFRVRVLDPAGDGWWADHQQMASAESSLERIPPPDPEGVWQISDVPGFFRGLQELGEAALLSFAGQYRTAQERAPRLRVPGQLAPGEQPSDRDDLPSFDASYEEPLERRAPVDRELVGSFTGTEQGVRLSMPLHDGRLLEAFTGVRPERLQAAREGDFERAGMLRQAALPRSEQRHEDSKRAGVLRKPMDDGRVLELQIVS
jgi:hypothetical protein